MSTGKKGRGSRGETITEPASNVRNNWNDVLEDINVTGKRIIMTRYGKPKAVLVPLSDLDHLPGSGGAAAALSGQD